LSDEPDRQRALEARVEEARLKVGAAKERLADNQTARRAIEKDVAMHQGRLSKFREQAMAVKTNQEYHAIQHEIAFADAEVKKLEEKILEGMLEADDLTTAMKASEAALAATVKDADSETRALAAENTELTQSLETIAGERSALTAGLTANVLALFELVARRRNGVAIAEARDGICTICHVRLRPQVFNTVRRNEDILQCDHCNRILYFMPRPAESAPGATDAVTPQAS
jgi:predicted  nucleic acid-binding Zn-ribbon protein